MLHQLSQPGAPGPDVFSFCHRGSTRILTQPRGYDVGVWPESGRGTLPRSWTVTGPSTALGMVDLGLRSGCQVLF